MTFDEVLAKRNEARKIRNDANEELESITNNILVKGMMNAEYNWGYWDAVITIMKNLKLKEIAA